MDMKKYREIVNEVFKENVEQKEILSSDEKEKLRELLTSKVVTSFYGMVVSRMLNLQIKDIMSEMKGRDKWAT